MSSENHPINVLLDESMGASVTLAPNRTTSIVVPLIQ
ncbi:hypothetical protein BDD14_5274 [Edaphobacter modestus]|uniref:Uncharacterized protein n=1 Tax=Edaphobacter modestus TaxID=388466 RepID=A0A4Q7Z0G7_9BACT|nr:hypothetical protein BDD14_5274 [Edaphobacter modestus]